jgi:membrane fusion protein (multidrug efflux system)
VYVLDKAMKAEMRQVTEGFAMGKETVISAGLREGDRIITAGMMKVQPGVAVRDASAEDMQKARQEAAAVAEEKKFR